jgi:hypothetical protein
MLYVVLTAIACKSMRWVTRRTATQDAAEFDQIVADEIASWPAPKL